MKKMLVVTRWTIKKSANVEQVLIPFEELTTLEWELGWGPGLQALVAVNVYVLVNERESIALASLACIRFVIHTSMVLVLCNSKRLLVSPQIFALHSSTQTDSKTYLIPDPFFRNKYA